MAALTLTGCAGCGKKTPPPVPKTPETTDMKRVGDVWTEQQAWVTKNVKVVYFDFDKSTVRKDMEAVIVANAAALKGKTDLNLTIEGNCDERGTVEYNMALGEKRANAVRKALIEKGVDAKRLATITKGKANPVVPNAKNEADHQKNRRAEFIATR
jgi:peptidoglycan-associated lipoprotein